MHPKLVALLGGALSLGLVNAASAADMAVKARPVIAPIMVNDWTGFYLGGALGGRWTDSSWNTTCQETGAPGGNCLPFPTLLPNNNPQSFNSSAFRGSIFGGYNRQISRWVVGVEGDIGWADNNRTNAGIPGLESLSTAVAGAPGLDTSTVKQTWDAGLRGRVGFLATPSVLIFGTGGVAFAHVEASAHCGTTFPVGWCTSFNVPRTDTTSSDRVGWTLGGGVEAKVTSNWLLRGEYRYADFGSMSFTQLQGPPLSITSTPTAQRLGTELIRHLSVWRISSVAPSSRSTDLSSIQQLKSPGIVRGFFTRFTLT